MRRTVQLPFQDRSWGHDALDMCPALVPLRSRGHTSSCLRPTRVSGGFAHISSSLIGLDRHYGQRAGLDKRSWNCGSCTQLITPNDLGLGRRRSSCLMIISAHVLMIIGRLERVGVGAGLEHGPNAGGRCVQRACPRADRGAGPRVVIVEPHAVARGGGRGGRVAGGAVRGHATIVPWDIDFPTSANG